MLKTLLFCAIFVIAQQGACNSKKKEGKVELFVKPRICILAEGEEKCKDDLEIWWTTKAKRPISACLFIKNEENPLVCWEKHLSGAYQLSVETIESIAFVLKKNTNNMLAEKEFEVVHDSKRYRRSRRNPWSFF